MMIRQIALVLGFTAICFTGSSQKQAGSVAMSKVQLYFEIDDDGIPLYQVSYAGKPVIMPSRLGFKLANGMVLDSNFHLIQKDTITVDERWSPVLGEVSSIRNHYRQITFQLQNLTPPNVKMNVVFRVFEDGIGFRYEFPAQDALNNFIVTSESTSFNQTADHSLYWIPADGNSNEYNYTNSKLSGVNGWSVPGVSRENITDPNAVQTPLLLKTTEGLYINIHEAALVNYPAMQLHVDQGNYHLQALLTPDAIGNKAYLTMPFHSPWRTIIISDKAADIIASKIILNLNDPSRIENTSWIKPLKYMAVWWEMLTNKSTWTYSEKTSNYPEKPHGANTANVKRYIDFASANNINALLIEGWNTGWNKWSNDWTGRHFDFVTPYPDFNLQEITDYAKAKGVELIMHHPTGGDISSYERQMDTAFRLMKQFGYVAAKSEYAGKIIPRGEQLQGQWMVEHFGRAAEKAAHYQILLDQDKTVHATGLQRTWPNLLSTTAGRSNQFNATTVGNAPAYETILPFTTLVGGPMNYAPGIFKLNNFYLGETRRRVPTTLAKQLALYVVLYSPFQMLADLPENYAAHMDAFQFLKDVPLDWDDTKVLAASPGEFVTIARKEKGKDNWFVGAITNEKAHESGISLSFLPRGQKFIATVYRDAVNADWESNPAAYQVNKFKVDASTSFNFIMAKGGGVAISIVPATSSNMINIPSY